MSTSTAYGAADPRLSGLLPALQAFPGKLRVGLFASEPIPRVASMVAGVDALLGGGWPRGRVSEVVGPRSSGKTSLILTLLAAATRRGEVVAYVDLAGTLHAESVTRAGADVQRVLWVWPPSAIVGMRCTELLLQAGGFAVVVLDLGMVIPQLHHQKIWSRLLQAAERSHTALIVLAPHRAAGSFSALGINVGSPAVRWHPGAWPLFEGFDATVTLLHNKLGPLEGQASFTARASCEFS